ncbi:hypothetical protein [Psychrobacter sp. I-STPA10]|uniref:hypothetical protein n=1 Tax=Psychrobacter sp. I-STPA10 TaxID=2585769 RepID=UPI001E40D179|nr:hypothetical protein [Psychrobacter sp. I-STPA10]
MDKEYTIEQMLSLSDAELAKEMRGIISYFLEQRTNGAECVYGVVDRVTDAAICIGIMSKD